MAVIYVQDTHSILTYLCVCYIKYRRVYPGVKLAFVIRGTVINIF